MMKQKKCINCENGFVGITEDVRCTKNLMPMRLLGDMLSKDVAETCPSFKEATGFFAWLLRM